MIQELEILTVLIHNRYIGCALDEIEKVIKDTSVISGYKDTLINAETAIYKLGELLGIPEKVDYNSLLLIQNNAAAQMYIEIPNITDIKKINTSQILVVPDYIRRKQNPFLVWGYAMEKERMLMLITFSHFGGIKDEK